MYAEYKIQPVAKVIWWQPHRIPSPSHSKAGKIFPFTVRDQDHHPTQCSLGPQEPRPRTGPWSIQPVLTSAGAWQPDTPCYGITSHNLQSQTQCIFDAPQKCNKRSSESFWSALQTTYIVISRSKMHDRDWPNMHHVPWVKSQYWPANRS